MNKIMLSMLVNLLENLDQIAVEGSKTMLGVIKDLLVKLGGEQWETWFEELKRFLRRETCWIKVFKTYVVDCTMSLADMIRLAGFESGQFNTDITEYRFPIARAGLADEWEFKVFWFGENVEGFSSEGAKGRIEKEDSFNPWQVAGIEHLLTYGQYNPNEQLKYPIVALGSVGWVNGFRSVPCLIMFRSGRYLSLGRLANKWHAGYRFLAVRKKISRTSAS